MLFRSGELQLLGTAKDFGTPTDCRFPHLFFDSATGKFLATYVNATGGDTMFAEFKYDSTGDALVPASPTEVLVTDRATVPCQLGVGYSSTWQRLSFVSIEGACGGLAHDMLFDQYKTAR